ncbi:MAG: hypothetical protein ACLUJR_05680 [Mediterraneibacter gnavus]
MYKNGEFEEYDRYNKEMESYLAEALVQVEKDSDEWAYEYAKNKVDFWKNIQIFHITLSDQEINMVLPILMRCVIGKNRCGSGQNQLVVRNFSWYAGNYCR